MLTRDDLSTYGWAAFEAVTPFDEIANVQNSISTTLLDQAEQTREAAEAAATKVAIGMVATGAVVVFGAIAARRAGWL